MKRDQFNNIQLETVTNSIPDLMPLFVMFRQSSCVSETSMDNWKRLAAVRESINGSGTNLSCGVCKSSMMSDILTFLTVRGYFNGN